VAKGVVVPIDGPLFGTMGLAPVPEMNRISSGPPGVHTGNLDNKDLVAGTMLYIPTCAARCSQPGTRPEKEAGRAYRDQSQKPFGPYERSRA